MLYKDDIPLFRYQFWRTTRHHYNMKSLFDTAIFLVVFSIVQGMYIYVLQHVHILDLNLSKYWKQTCIRQSTERIEYKSVKVFLLWYFSLVDSNQHLPYNYIAIEGSTSYCSVRFNLLSMIPDVTEMFIGKTFCCQIMISSKIKLHDKE